MWLWEVNQYRRESEEGDVGTAKMTRNGVGKEGVRISTRAGVGSSWKYPSSGCAACMVYCMLRMKVKRCRKQDRFQELTVRI